MKIILHAPTANAYERAKRNLGNIRREDPDAIAEIIVNAQAAPVAASDPDRDDTITRICANSLTNAKLQPPDAAQLVPNAMLHIAKRQEEGWIYIRA